MSEMSLEYCKEIINELSTKVAIATPAAGLFRKGSCEELRFNDLRKVYLPILTSLLIHLERRDSVIGWFMQGEGYTYLTDKDMERKAPVSIEKREGILGWVVEAKRLGSPSPAQPVPGIGGE